MAIDNQKFFVRVILVVLVVSLICCIYMSMTAPKVDCTCDCKIKEEYGNVGKTELAEAAEFDPTLKIANNFQRVDLNAPIDPETGAHKNLLFGKANRIINDDKTYTLDVEANLYVLGGDTYDSGIIPALGLNSYDGNYTKFNVTEANEKYRLYLSNASGAEQLVGELKKDGDGVYKLKTVIPEESQKMKTVNVYFEGLGERVLVITGSFK